MTSLLICFGLVISSPVFPQVATAVDEALERLRRGDRPDRVTRDVGLAACRRIEAESSHLDDPTLRELAQLARAGRSNAELGPALVAVVRSRGVARGAALAELTQLPPECLDEAAVGVPDDELLPLFTFAQEVSDPDTATGALALVVRRSDPSLLREVVALIMTWAEQDESLPLARRLLLELPRTRHPRACLEAIASLGLVRAGVLASLTSAARELVQQDASAADEALRLVSEGQVGPGGVVLASLGGISLADEQRWLAAAAIIDELVNAAADDPEAVAADHLAAAIDAGSELLVASVVPLLHPLAAAGRTAPLRATALRAMGKLCYRDQVTVDTLIETLSDPQPEVASAAYEALSRRAGVSLPMRADVWRRWRETVALPEVAPWSDEERLAREREMRGRALRRRHRSER